MGSAFDDVLHAVVRTTTDLWRKGWAERNAGNLSVRLAGEERPEAVREAPWSPLPSPVPAVGGESFLFTAAGSFLRRVERRPRDDLGVVEVDGGGAAYRVVWGYEHGALPTSELSPHLMAHAARIRATGGADRAVLHTHPTGLIALTYARDLDSASLTRLLWEMHTECIVVFPEGCGFVPWRLPGSEELAVATAEALAGHPMALWQHHGLVATGPDPDTAFGLVETAEKAAEIWLRVAALGPVERRLSTGQLRALAERFGVEPNPDYLS